MQQNAVSCFKDARRNARHPFFTKGSSAMLFRSRCGFTLVEIMIVVLIIGMLLAIAVPNFIQARETSRAKGCVANLYQINSAKLQCMMDYQLAPGSTATFSIDGTTAATPGPNGNYQLVGNATVTGYMRHIPYCPSGGMYDPRGVDLVPTCNITGAAGSGYAPNEKWWHGY